VEKEELKSKNPDMHRSIGINSPGNRYVFQPVAVESLGLINCSAVSFLSGLGRRTAEVSGETQEGSFLFQRLSVLIQSFSAVLLHDCFVDEAPGHSS